MTDLLQIFKSELSNKDTLVIRISENALKLRIFNDLSFKRLLGAFLLII
jgi:hypothetical protein